MSTHTKTHQITRYSLEPTFVIPDSVKLVLKENQQVTPATETTFNNETDNREPEIEIHIDTIEQSAIEEEVSTTLEEKPISNRAKKKKKWVANIGKSSKTE
ncbi:unnamed protein product [Macrosiphum euphorbiae]|uniref:Uncharacterized protein n=1 Tax=Macrosiphum euphorbiae TaxID=13131 RepID=A0AAV0Y954_9HEMI|nr:unnamed protein product [Macrosiphum euphorbiae]